MRCYPRCSGKVYKISEETAGIGGVDSEVEPGAYAMQVQDEGANAADDISVTEEGRPAGIPETGAAIPIPIRSFAGVAGQVNIKSTGKGTVQFLNHRVAIIALQEDVPYIRIGHRSLNAVTDNRDPARRPFGRKESVHLAFGWQTTVDLHDNRCIQDDYSNIVGVREVGEVVKFRMGEGCAIHRGAARERIEWIGDRVFKPDPGRAGPEGAVPGRQEYRLGKQGPGATMGWNTSDVKNDQAYVWMGVPIRLAPDHRQSGGDHE